MKVAMRKKVLLLLLIAFVCCSAQFLFDPYISFFAVTNWRLWAVVFVNAATLTILLIIGWAFYRHFKEQGQKRIKIMTIILFVYFLVYAFIKQKVLLTASALSIITIITVAACNTGFYASGLVILIGIACFIYRKVKARKGGIGTNIK